jgi:plasmid maintenance system killer protein
LRILFINGKLEKEFNSEQLLIRRHGPQRSRLIKRRLIQIHAAAALEDLRSLPQVRCHELKGNRAGQLSVDLDHPYRLIFEPADAPIPRREDGGLDWMRVTTVLILGVEDTHE